MHRPEVVVQTVGPSPDSDQPVQAGPVPARREPTPDTPLAAIQRFAGNRAVAAMFGGGPLRVAGGADVPAPAPPVVPGRPGVRFPPPAPPWRTRWSTNRTAETWPAYGNG